VEHDNDESRSAGGARVLVVDDDPDARAIVRTLLEAQGYHVACARTAAEARARLRRSTYALMVCDYVLPDDNGRDLVRALKRDGLLAQTRVIMISASEDAQAPTGVALLAKPLDFRRLFNLVRALIARASMPDFVSA
jgi:DNA-binding response OmpR family regulator